MPGERTEQATQHKREKARRDGDVLHSRELTSAAGVLAAVTALGVLAGRTMEAWRANFAASLDLGSPAHWDGAEVLPTILALRRLAVPVLMPVALVMAALSAGSLCTGILQTGGLSLSGSALEMKIDRISPAANLKNLFSLRGASRLGKTLIPAGVLGVIAMQRISSEMELPPFATGRLEMLGAEAYGLLQTAAWLLFAWALVDYVVEWRSRESRLRMSRDEMREEYKETEGSPQIRSRIRGLQRQMRRRRVKSDVGRAAVVLTNPTHYAVALGFDFTTMDAPKVLAKGRNLLAEEIKVEARWAGVPIIENPPLARSLYRTVEVGQAIPVELYSAVAAILAYLYRQRVEAELRERRAHAQASTEKKANVGPVQQGATLHGALR